MSRIKPRDTKPEMAVRKLIYGMGYRYRLHDKNLPGKPDIVFKGRRKAIFVNGCFWHLHGCNQYRYPKSKLDFWGPKLESNKARDARNMAALSLLGWDVLIIWECELKRLEELKQKITVFLEETK